MKFCKFCHFTSDYEHSHFEKWTLLSHEGNPYVQDVKISDGTFTDVNGICLPCQAMRRFNC